MKLVGNGFIEVDSGALIRISAINVVTPTRNDGYFRVFVNGDNEPSRVYGSFRDEFVKLLISREANDENITTV